MKSEKAIAIVKRLEYSENSLMERSISVNDAVTQSAMNANALIRKLFLNPPLIETRMQSCVMPFLLLNNARHNRMMP